MRRCTLQAARIFGGLALGVAIFLDGSSACGQTREMHASLAGQLRIFQLRVMSGRISASGPTTHRNLTSNTNQDRSRERLTIDLKGGRPDVTYERIAPDERFVIDIDDGTKVSAQMIPRSMSDRAAVNFLQPVDGPLVLTVSTDSESKRYQAATVWHLMLIEPEVCREHLLPLLEVLRPAWKLGEQSEEIENLLCHGKEGRPAIRHYSWQQLIGELASNRYVERERAERQLHALGPIILPFLRSQEPPALDPEQAFRIRRLLRELSPDAGEDTSERVVAWLTEDASVWFALLRRDDEGVRYIATERLSGLLNTRVDFDPAASNAVRDHQWAELRQRFSAVLDSVAPASPEQKSD
ncbi:MAG TPA: hypothetical protein VGN12_01025 [Pirellulales bacterium]